MGLLRADLQSLANGFRGEGQRALVGRFVPPLVLAAMHWTLGAMLLEHRRMLPLLERGGDPVHFLFAHALSPGPVVAGWIGFALAQRQLFEAPTLERFAARVEALGWLRETAASEVPQGPREEGEL